SKSPAGVPEKLLRKSPAGSLIVTAAAGPAMATETIAKPIVIKRRIRSSCLDVGLVPAHQGRGSKPWFRRAIAAPSGSPQKFAWEFELCLAREIHMHDQSGGALFKRGARERQRSAPDGDEHLLALIREGDVRAFESVYRNYYGPLTRFLQRLTRRPQVTEEVLNDTMLVLWHRPESFRGDSKLSTWMFGIAYRKAMKALRRLDEPAE